MFENAGRIFLGLWSWGKALWISISDFRRMIPNRKERNVGLNCLGLRYWSIDAIRPQKRVTCIYVTSGYKYCICMKYYRESIAFITSLVSYCVILCHIVSIVSLIGSRRHRLCWSLPDPTRPVSSGVRSQSTLQEKPKETKSEIQEVAGIELRLRHD